MAVDKLPPSRPCLLLFDLVLEVCQFITEPQVDIFFMSLCVVWSGRNTIVWKNRGFNPLFMASWVVRSLKAYHKYHPPKVKNIRRPVTRWECPPSGRLKINIDGAYNAKLAQSGIKVIIRDEHGLCMAAFAHHIPYSSSALHMEVEACRAGLLIAIHQGWNDCVLESDYALLITAL